MSAPSGYAAARLFGRRAVVFYVLAPVAVGLMVGCVSRPAKLYEGDYLPKSQVAVVRSDSHTIIVRVDSVQVGEHVSIDTKGELVRRSAGEMGQPFEVTAGTHEFEVGFVGWEPVPDTLIVLDIKGTTYTYARQSRRKDRLRYYRSTNKRTFTLTLAAGESYLLKSTVRNPDLPLLPEGYLEVESDKLEGLRKAREAELQLDYPVKLELDWETHLEPYIDPDRR